MRMSVRQDDPGYSLEAHRCSAYLDGEKVEYCITADEEKGLVVVLDADENGKIKIVNDHLVDKFLYGKVEIRKSND